MEHSDLRRTPNWRLGLGNYLSAVARKKFKPGSHDCALFVAGAVEAMTGTDFAKGHRGYRTLKQGRAKLKKKGYSDHVAYAADQLPEIPVLMAQVGDIAVVDDGAGEDVLGVVQGSGVYALGLEGLAVVSLVSAKRAFKI